MHCMLCLLAITTGEAQTERCLAATHATSSVSVSCAALLNIQLGMLPTAMPFLCCYAAMSRPIYCRIN